MKYYVNKKQMQQCELYAQKCGIAPITLMDNAGTAAARVMREIFSLVGKNITVVCGRGNNGGDGFVVARKLYENGVKATVILAEGKPTTTDSLTMFNRAVSMGIPVTDANEAPDDAVRFLSRAEIIVDAVYGTGFHTPLSSSDRWLFGEINRRDIPIIALDIPSGADSDSGECDPDCIKATHTVAFQYPKRGQKRQETAMACGQIITVEIGIPHESIDEITDALCSPEKSDIAKFFPKRSKESNKGTYGRALLICGSVGMVGAAAFAAEGCLKSGVGLCELAVSEKIYPILASRLFEPVYTVLKNYESILINDTLSIIENRLKKSSACLIGCGISTSVRAEKMTRFLLKNTECPLVIDADGINNISKHINELKEAKMPVIITPHPGEMSRLCGKSIAEINADRVNTAVDFSREYGVFTVLKGHETVIACPDGRCFLNTTGNAGMATGGSGDVLAGIIVSLLAQGFKPDIAAFCGVWLHGAAGDKASEIFSETSCLPTLIIDCLPQIFSDLERI